MGKGITYSTSGRDCPCYGCQRGLSIAMGHVRDTKHGTGSGKRRSWRGSEGQAYCMKRIKERAQR